MSDTALLLLDLQRDFLDPNGRMPISTKNAGRVISSANRLSEHAAACGWLQIFIKNEFRKADRIGNFFRKGAAVEGTVGAEIDPRILIPANGLVMSKTTSDAFAQTALAGILENSGIRHIIILGVMAEGCVRATVQSARSRGLPVTVIADGVASTHEFLTRFALKSMRKAGAAFQESAEIVRT